MSCEYCMGERHVNAIYPDGSLSDCIEIDSDGVLIAYIDAAQAVYNFPAKYCPMCGSKLGDSDD